MPDEDYSVECPIYVMYKIYYPAFMIIFLFLFYLILSYFFCFTSIQKYTKTSPLNWLLTACLGTVSSYHGHFVFVSCTLTGHYYFPYFHVPSQSKARPPLKLRLNVGLALTQLTRFQFSTPQVKLVGSTSQIPNHFRGATIRQYLSCTVDLKSSCSSSVENACEYGCQHWAKYTALSVIIESLVHAGDVPAIGSMAVC